MTKVTQAHVDARTESIREAAVAVFIRKGVDRATMQEIAAEAGLSAGAIYRYYPSKEDLLRAVFEEALDNTTQMFEQAREGAASALDAMIRAGRAALSREPDECVDINLHSAIIAASLTDPDGIGAAHRDVHRHIAAMVTQFIADAQAEGSIRDDIHAVTLGTLLTAWANGMQEMLIIDGISQDQVEASLEAIQVLLRPCRPDGAEHD